MKKLLAIVLAAIMILSLVACSAAKSSTEEKPQAETTAPAEEASSEVTEEAEDSDLDGEFKLGVMLPFTGSISVSAEDGKNACEMACDYINANGGFNGKKVVPIYYDTQQSAEEAVKCATKLVNHDQVDAVINSFNSGECLASADIFNNAGTLMIGLGTADTWLLPEKWPYVYRGSCTVSKCSGGIADAIVESGAKSVAVFNSTDDAGVSIADAFIAACEERGIEVVLRETCESGDTDFAAQVAAIVSAEADTVYISCDGTVMGPVIRQIRQGGYQGILWNKDVTDNSIMEQCGVENAQYVACVYPYVCYKNVEDCTIPIMREFLEEYYARYEIVPPTEVAYRMYDSMMVLWEATKIAQSNASDDLLVAMDQVKIDGLGGQIDFTNGFHEAYGENGTKFIILDGKNQPWVDWVAAGGLEELNAKLGK